MNKIILLNAIVGSQAYGTNTPDSDIDTKGVYLQDPMEVLGMEYKEQINLDKDACLYEVRRFLQLLCSGNPNIEDVIPTHARLQMEITKIQRIGTKTINVRIVGANIVTMMS